MVVCTEGAREQNLCVGVTELDGDVSLELVLEPDGQDARDGFDDGGLSVCDMTDGTDVDCVFKG